MKNLGGGIRVRSEVNRGTSFDLYFPQELGTGKLADKPSPVATPAGKEILLVDDEELVGRSTEELLSQAGYVPHFFNDSTTALAAYRDRHADISLVVMDMIMPGMDGSRLYRAIKEVNPAARFLIISGFSLNSATQILLDEGDAVFLTKPFQSADLIAAVNRILKS
jgi:two-component system, cell cycle sensor histidine kinase and response regulator CckA